MNDFLLNVVETGKNVIDTQFLKKKILNFLMNLERKDAFTVELPRTIAKNQSLTIIYRE